VTSFDGVVLNRYPDPFQAQLRSKLAELNRTTPNRLFVGVGSDEVIDLLLRIFCVPQEDSILLLEPTYGMYRVAATIQGARVLSCLLTDDFQIDLPAVKATLEKNTKLIFCCSPNNPTGNLLRTDDILELCRMTEALVVVDEAYVEFAGNASVLRSDAEIPNLVVMRTLSKAWGLAGIRLGYCLADPLVISYLLKVKAPYNINVLTSAVALRGLNHPAKLHGTIDGIVRERINLAEELRRLKFVEQVFPSDANFILIRCRGARAVYEALVRKGIIIRDRSAEPKLQNCLRITVGTPDENSALLAAMHELEEVHP
jgi:histidinol-phosphate aminotransferase